MSDKQMTPEELAGIRESKAINGCEIIRCHDYKGGKCHSELDYVDRETGEDTCYRNPGAVPRVQYEDKCEINQLREENGVLWAILKTCPGCKNLVRGIVYGCDIQHHIDLSGHCNQYETAPGETWGWSDCRSTRIATICNDIIALLAENDRLRARFTVPIVCMCGSTRFKQTWIAENARLTGEGNIVLTVGLWGHHERVFPAPEVKAKLDDLHKRKIDLCDWVWVLDVGGYIGDSTKSEIEYARKLGKPVRYLSQFPGYQEPDDPLAVEVDHLREELQAAQARETAMRGAVERAGQTLLDPPYYAAVPEWITEVLSSSAGKELLERMQKLELVAEAAKAYEEGMQGDYETGKAVGLSTRLRLAVKALGGE